MNESGQSGAIPYRESDDGPLVNHRSKFKFKRQVSQMVYWNLMICHFIEKFLKFVMVAFPMG
jgi:hypothetical protein